jgi:NADPH2:quinone reductase
LRAVVITEPGDADVLAVADLDPRDPEEGEVRIAVKAATVNPTDIGFRQRGGGDLPKPWIPGMDAAGVVESLGPGIDRLEVGQEVMAAVSARRPEGGAQQELLVAPAASVVSIPDGASLPEAATLPMNGLTAESGLDMLGLSDGQTLAVAGGAGLLASYVIVLAKERGLRVIADAKPEDEELVRGFGADVVVPRSDNFGDTVRAVAPDGVDAVYDTALIYRDAFAAVRDGGGVVFVRGWDGNEVEDRGIRVHPVVVGRVLERTDWLDELRVLASDGRIKLRVAREFPPERVAEAHRLMDAGGLRGRAVIVF